MDPIEFNEEEDGFEVCGITDVEGFINFKKSVLEDIKGAFAQFKTQPAGKLMSPEEVALQENSFIQRIEEPLENLQPFYKDLMEMKGKSERQEEDESYSDMESTSEAYPQDVKEKLAELEEVYKQAAMFEEILQTRCEKLQDLDGTLHDLIRKLEDLNLSESSTAERENLIKEIETLSYQKNWDLPIMQYLSDMCRDVRSDTENIYKKIA